MHPEPPAYQARRHGADARWMPATRGRCRDNNIWVHELSVCAAWYSVVLYQSRSTMLHESFINREACVLYQSWSIVLHESSITRKALCFINHEALCFMKALSITKQCAPPIMKHNAAWKRYHSQSIVLYQSGNMASQYVKCIGLTRGCGTENVTPVPWTKLVWSPNMPGLMIVGDTVTVPNCPTFADFLQLSSHLRDSACLSLLSLVALLRMVTEMNSHTISRSL